MDLSTPSHGQVVPGPTTPGPASPVSVTPVAAPTPIVPPKPAGPLVEKFCVVCGMGSHRRTWKNVSGENVACDNHTPEQINKGVANATAKAAAAKAAPAKPGVVIPPTNPGAKPMTASAPPKK